VLLCAVCVVCCARGRRPVGIVDCIFALVTMFCGIAYVVEIMLGNLDYLPVVITSGLFSISREIRNTIKSVRVGCIFMTNLNKTQIIAPEPPPQSQTQKQEPKKSANTNTQNRKKNSRRDSLTHREEDRDVSI